MALGIVDGVTFQISRVLEWVFEVIEYRVAKHARAREARQGIRAEMHWRGSVLGLYEIRNGPPQRHLPPIHVTDVPAPDEGANLGQFSS